MTTADRLKEYENLFQQSLAYNPATFQQDFEKAYGEETNYNKDLIESRARAIAQAQTLPSQLREEYYSGPIRNPLAQEALIAMRRGNITGDITSLTDLLAARGARYQDVLGKHLAGYQTDAQRAQIAAENAWRLYQDAVQQDQFRAQMARGSGGGGGNIDLGGIIELLTGGRQPEVVQQVAQPSLEQRFINMVQQIRDKRSTQNIESQMNRIHKELMSDAQKVGLRVDPSALWVWLGNTNKKGPYTPILFK